MERGATLRGRTHRCKVLGLGHQRSRGVKAGAIVDLDAAESAIRLAVDAAERMAGVEVESVIVNMSGGRLASRVHAARDRRAAARAVGDAEMQRVLEAAAQAGAEPGTRARCTRSRTAFRSTRNAASPIPRGMIGEELGADSTSSSCDVAAARNLMLAIERCHLRVAAIVASPYAAGLSTLVDDEAELGAALIDFGGGATTIGAFAGDRLAHVDAVAVGGHHVTMDVARGLSVSLADAERLKTLYGACVASPADERETICDPPRRRRHGSSDADRRSPNWSASSGRASKRSSNWRATGWPRRAIRRQAGRRLVLTGGASQLTGLADLARAIVSPQARMGRPLGVEGLPEIGQEPGVRRPRSA